MAKRKVAILGGGIGALSTAWNLTKDPKWTDQIESLTIYQMGWRLGGKCATGRGPNGRVEEHGIHLFGGGYYNALRMMRDVYREAYGASGDADFQHQFQNQFTSVSVNGNEKSSVRFPPSPLTLDNVPVVASISEMLSDAITTLRALFVESSPTPSLKTMMRFGDGSIQELRGTLSPAHPSIAPVLEDVDRLADQVRRGAADVSTTLARIGAVAGPNRRGLDAVDLYPLDDEDRSPLTTYELQIAWAVPRWMSTLNFIFALTTGWLVDIAGKGKTFAQLDEADYAQWLSKHGAWPSTIELDIVQAPLRILYQYKGGESGKKSSRSMGAGGYVHWTLRTLAYMHSPFWFFRFGTGDTVITPLYEALLAKGVKFSFFNKVEKLSLSADKKSIGAIELRLQATTKSGQAYDPLDCGFWPSSPRVAELNEEQELTKLPPNELESYWSRYRESERKVLTVGADFDEVVLAISLGALPILCSELVAQQPDWSRMISSVKTVETQSLQIWLDRSSGALGVNDDLDAPIEPDDSGLGAGFAKPFDGFSDFSDLIRWEKWPIPIRPKALWYFSDVLSTPSTSPDLTNLNYPQERHAVAFANSRKFLEDELGRLLSAFSPSRGGFDYRRLVPTDPGRVTDNDSILAQQVVRANVQPSDRYVQALAGTTKYRLEAGRSQHFTNLYLAGDWTYNGLNVGCVEATVMSGMLAANDLLGRPHDDGVVGYFGR